MNRASPNRHSFIYCLSLLSLFLSLVQAQCNTDQNPYCRGNKKFEAICCPYPNVCYWSDRAGTPACCPAGQVCGVNGGGEYSPPPNPPSTVYSTPTTPPLSTITSYVTHPDQTTPAGGGGGGGGAPILVTTTNEPVYSVLSTVTSGAAGVWSTVTSGAAGVYSTITSTLGVVATEAASGLVQNLNAAPPARPEISYQFPLAAAIAVMLWQLV